MGLTERAIAWIEARGLDVEMAVNLGLASFARSNGGEELVIPYFVGNEVVNHKYRTLEGKQFRQDKDAVKCLFNFNALLDPTLKDQPVIIFEGEFDCMVAIQCGFLRSVSVPDGAPAHEIKEDEQSRKYTYLEHAKTALRDCREIILATDADGPGQNLLNDLAVRLGKARCKWVKYPKGCKDLNETFLRYGERGVREVFARAQWCNVNGVYKMSDLPPYPFREAFSTGIEGLDDHYKIRMGDFCVVTGIPGHGKSTFVNDMLCRVSDGYGWRVAIASFEQHPQADHRRALREWHAARREMYMTDQQLADADAWIDEHFVFIVPSDDDLANLSWSLDMCATAVIRHGVRIVVIDPWNELDHDRPPDMTLTEYTGKAIKEFKRLARQFDVHVIVVAHPTKLTGSEKPTLYHISDSSHWANKADIGIVVHRPDVTKDETDISIVKSRYYDQIGRPGRQMYRYMASERRYVHMPHSEIRSDEGWGK